MKTLNHLLSPITINGMTVPNRAVMPPMGTNLGIDNHVSEANLAYMKHMAGSGAGLIITEITCVHPSGLSGPSHIGIYDDKFLPGLTKWAGVIHDQGGKAIAQLHHTGRESAYMLQKGEAVGPSAIPSKVFRVPPKEMSLDLIHEVIAAFGQAALRAKKAGFDGVEIHGAHGYLVAQFLSALSNQRQDEYGGNTLQQRARFMIEVLASVRKNVGNDYPVLIRISTDEYIQDGYQVEDLLPILPELVKAGADCIHASIGTHGSPGGITSAAAEYESGFNLPSIAKIKKAVNIPVIGVGRFTDPSLADEVIANGQADLVAFGRQQLADPDYLKKAAQGRREDIRECIACNQGCIERLMLEPGTSIRCAINPRSGQELSYPQGPASKKKTVWIIGAGPAGLTAAYEAKRLGHSVRLFEKAEKPGGNLYYASLAPNKQVYGNWMNWLITQVAKCGVEIKTNTCVTPDMLKQNTPDAVILATGGEKIVPKIPGMDLPHVCDAWQILDGTVASGKNVAVIGGGLIGMETADFLRDKGASITLVEMLPRSPVGRMAAHGYFLHQRLRDGQCRFCFDTRLEAIENGAIHVISQEKTETLSPVDQVVIAVGMKPRDELKKALVDQVIPHVIVGDARQVRRIIEATEEGARAAWEL
ncbi:MAG: FAD-dependent oxidoreductase [Proteobacteria bacterium]|nr:FAD-dependent oxidoreductase [Pseudomonadota bacterium]MBU4470803.1 FAD-dependent oxidoreductase [Pseudomonadota bacterium]MCG2751469.1 FAD-dependent oxidoreductase [Desulfobacteraceae bacterium]